MRFIVVQKAKGIAPWMALGVVESIRWNLDKVIGDNFRWLTMIDIFRKVQRMWEPKTWTLLYVLVLTLVLFGLSSFRVVLVRRAFLSQIGLYASFSQIKSDR